MEPGPIKTAFRSLCKGQFRCFFQEPETVVVQFSEDGESQVGIRNVMMKLIMRKVETGKYRKLNSQ